MSKSLIRHSPDKWDIQRGSNMQLLIINLVICRLRLTVSILPRIHSFIRHSAISSRAIHNFHNPELNPITISQGNFCVIVHRDLQSDPNKREEITKQRQLFRPESSDNSGLFEYKGLKKSNVGVPHLTNTMKEHMEFSSSQKVKVMGERSITRFQEMVK